MAGRRAQPPRMSPARSATARRVMNDQSPIFPDDFSVNSLINSPAGTLAASALRPLCPQRVGYYGLENSAGGAQRLLVVGLRVGAATIDVGLLQNGAEFGKRARLPQLPAIRSGPQVSARGGDTPEGIQRRRETGTETGHRERAARARNATDAEAPYALSDRSRPRNGFTPAGPETRIAATTNPLNPPARRARTSSPAQPNPLDSDASDQGEPIRLASSESPITQPSAETASSPPLTEAGNAGSSVATQPTNGPEIPQLPTVSQLPDLTEANGSDPPCCRPKSERDGSSAGNGVGCRGGREGHDSCWRAAGSGPSRLLPATRLRSLWSWSPRLPRWQGE